MKKRWRDRNYKRFFIRLTWVISMIVFGIAVIGYYTMAIDEGWNIPGSFLLSVSAAFFCAVSVWGLYGVGWLLWRVVKWIYSGLDDDD